MQPFVKWIETNPFYVRDSWDFKKNKWVGPGRLQLSKMQKRILNHCLTPDKNGKLPYETILYSTVKKSGKTTLGGAMGAWYADQSYEGTEIYIMANNLEHAEGRVMKDIKYHCKKHNQFDLGEEDDPIKVIQYQIKYPNDTFIRALAQAFKTVAGSRHALTLTDELWGSLSEDARRVWDEMTPIPTVQNSLRVITTYAGFIGESELLWDLYLQGVGIDEHVDGQGEMIPELSDLPCWKNGKMFTYWDHVPRMPWQDDEYYETQMATLRPVAYLRLHENRWVTTHETFIPIDWWDEAAKHFEGPAEYDGHPYRDFPVFVGIDAAPTHDCTAIVGVTYDPKIGKVILLWHRIWTPVEGEDFDLDATVQKFMIDRHIKFDLYETVYDPTQLHSTMTQLRAKGLRVDKYVQSVGNMTKASQALFDLMKYDNLWAYPDAEFRKHLQNAVAKQEDRGFRIVKDKRKKHLRKPVDAAVALAMACYKAVDRMASANLTPIKIESPYADASAWDPIPAGEEALAWMFRSG